jgi:outer membrane receptor protein involved in Fe transport
MSSDVKVSEDGELMFRGSRKGDMIYMMDGIKSNAVSAIPSCAIGRVMVYTGGLPAKYGDTLGGVVIMETKSYFDLYRRWEAEQIKAGN